MAGQGAFGWYGKVPGAGDFLRRGLSPGFLQGWDRFAQGLLTTARAELGARWRGCYLAAPIWRFALAPGLCGPAACAGVMMPSVDRVGRQFPLCLAAEGGGSLHAAWCAAAPAWEALETAALAMLDPEAGPGRLEAALAALPAPGSVAAPARALGSARVAEGEQALAALALGDAGSLWCAAFAGRSRALLCSGLPEGPAEAAALFDADAPGWPAPEPCA
ncbi:type VI secretion system-associated protein TagF [Oceanicella sp. SM1341]|uniref:type VI secretion system-associated protein TagF n=1 Tax=Oceanicella sp. SM1341 TaxID=1548889 RepID=UPI000E4F9CA3|nr:type VI secretion system-associated protein TagF [Oceanicella sp. SM1341]